MSKENKSRSLSQNDPSSFSNPDGVRPTSMDIKWDVDFTARKLIGSVRYTLLRVNKAVSIVVFDVQDLKIKSVTWVDGDAESKLRFSIGPKLDTFGSPLEVELPTAKWTELVITINYETTSKSVALQWLSKEETSGKEFPYLFSKCSPIQARSLIPCQDTPSVKVPYTAEVVAPSELTVLMSAVKQEEINSDREMSGLRRHTFIQKIPIPSYLLAIVIGKLESKRLGPRSRVWSEKEILDAAAYEFEDTDKTLIAEEQLLGEYVWGVYDILVLPPSFPAGGMENPCLTFVTPTLIAGDKSLANVIAHEIAHSWTGNLVTNRTYQHFWLNEGLTMYVERRVLGILYGEQFRQLLAIGGLKALKETVNDMGPQNPMTALVPNLAGGNPSSCMTLIPYEKGFLFLYYLEQVVGGADELIKFLKDYIWKNAYKSVDTKRFREMFVEYFAQNGKGSQIAKIEWNTWLYATGYPAYQPKYDHTLVDVSSELKRKWLNWNPERELCPFSASDLDRFTLRSYQLLEFLAQINEDENPLGLTKIETLDRLYQLSGIQNSEIKFLWIKICIREKYGAIIPKALEFISQQGRLKFIIPIYKSLFTWDDAKHLTIETFQRNRPGMMAKTATMVAKIFQLEAD